MNEESIGIVTTIHGTMDKSIMQHLNAISIGICRMLLYIGFSLRHDRIRKEKYNDDSLLRLMLNKARIRAKNTWK